MVYGSRLTCVSDDAAPASADEAAAYDARCRELAHYKLGRVSKDDRDGAHRVMCPAQLGKVRFGALYLVSALGGSVGSYLLSTPNQIGVGASGAIFGLIVGLAAQLALGLSFRRHHPARLHRPAHGP